MLQLRETECVGKSKIGFNTSSRIYYKKFHIVLWPYGRVFGIIINIVYNRVPCLFGDLEDGFKYLDFNLKPNKYQKEHWAWLVEKVEKKYSSGAIDSYLELEDRF